MRFFWLKPQNPLEADLIEYLINLTTQENQLILDPFMGSGTTALAAKSLNRQFIGFERNSEYHRLSLERLGNPSPVKELEETPVFQQSLFEKSKRLEASVISNS